MPHKNLVIIPAFNEQNIIGKTINDIKNADIGPIDILVVDDGSTDKTAKKARKAGAIVVTLPFNLGVGAAGSTGYRYAMQNNYEKAVRFDADGQHNPHDIKRVLNALDQVDIVQTTRFNHDYPMSIVRKLSIGYYNFILSKLTHTKITDATSGFRGAKGDAIKQLALYSPNEYLGDTAAAAAAALKGFTFLEIPSEFQERQQGLPSQNYFKLFYHMIRSSISITILALFGERATRKATAKQKKLKSQEVKQ